MPQLTELSLSPFFTLSQDLLCIVGTDGYFKTLNPAFIDLLGYQEEELYSAPYITIVHPEDLEKTLQAVLAFEQGIKTPCFENRLRKKDGGYCWVMWTLSELKNDLFYAIGKDCTQQKLDRQKLEESNNDLLTVLDNITDGFFTLDHNWIVRYSNRQAERIYGRKSSEDVGKNLLELLPGIRESKFYAMTEQALRENKKIEFENYLPLQEKWVDVSIYPSPKGLLVFFRDITEKKLAIEKMKESNERYRLVSLGTSEAVWDRKLCEDQIYWHGDNYKKQFGYDFIDNCAPLSQWKENIHPDDYSALNKSIQQAFSDPNEHSWSGQYRFKKMSGEYVYTKDCAYILRDESGKAVRVVGAMVDITGQKLAEDALVESEKKYRSLFNNAPLPQIIFAVDSLTVLNVNDAAIRLYGYSAEEFTLSQVTAIQLEREHNEFFTNFKNLRQQGRQTGTVTHVKKDGTPIQVDYSAVIINYNNQQCVLITTSDITEKRKLEQQLSREKLLRQKQVTQATIAGQERERVEIGRELHDNINQMITTVKLYLEMARENEALRMDLIKRSEKVTASVIEEIRTLSKQLLPPTLEKMPLADTIGELIASYSLTQKFNVHFSHFGDLEKLPGDLHTCIYRVVQEQLNNIVKYAQATEVNIELEVGAALWLTVRDNGKGFDTTKRRQGIGITNMKSRAEIYNGKVRVESSPGKGCTLKLHIPGNKELGVSL